MKKLNKNYEASKVVMALSNNVYDHLIGSIVKFKNPDCTHKRENIFEIGGSQRVYGYDEKGNYTMIDGVRLFPVTCKETFGTPADISELEFISMNN